MRKTARTNSVSSRPHNHPLSPIPPSWALSFSSTFVVVRRQSAPSLVTTGFEPQPPFVFQGRPPGGRASCIVSVLVYLPLLLFLCGSLRVMTSRSTPLDDSDTPTFVGPTFGYYRHYPTSTSHGIPIWRSRSLYCVAQRTSAKPDHD